MVENQKNLILLTIISALIIAGVIFWATTIYLKEVEKLGEVLDATLPPGVGPAAIVHPPESKEEGLAKCLSQKGIKFYGTYWCGWCQKQKELFGQAAKYLPYIECAPDRANREEIIQCQEAKVGPIPDWRFPDGRQELGMLSLEKLAELSGCPLE